MTALTALLPMETAAEVVPLGTVFWSKCWVRPC